MIYVISNNFGGKYIELINEKYIIKTGTHICVDYISFSFPLRCRIEDSELMIVNDVVNMISIYLNISGEDIYQEEFSTLGYRYQYKLGNSITLRLCGPFMNNGYRSCMLEMKGEGCREFERRNPKKEWVQFLKHFYINLQASPTRIDLAIDDFDGNIVNFKYIKDKLDKKLFNTSFRTHNYTIHGNEDDGFSLQFGSHSSSQMLVIYEKNKEQISRNIPCPQDYWLRYEMRYMKNKVKDVVHELCNLESDEMLKEYFMKRLYEMLDIKVDSNISLHNVDRLKTDKPWLDFLGNIEKSKLKRYDKDLASFESYLNYMDPRVAFYFSNLIVQCEGDIYEAITRLIKVTLNHLDKFDNKKLKRYNDYLKEAKLDLVQIEDLEEIRFKLEQELKSREEIPF